METIHWWWSSSPCLCNLSLRHTEISSLITDYYHNWDVVWSCLCRIDGCYACCLIYCDGSRRHKNPEPHAFLLLSYVILVICDSSKKYFLSNVRAVWVQPISFLFRKNEQFSSISRKCKMPFSILFDCCNQAIQFWIPFGCIEIFFRFSSIILQELNWLIVILDKNESTIFNKVNYVFLGNVSVFLPNITSISRKSIVKLQFLAADPSPPRSWAAIIESRTERPQIGCSQYAITCTSDMLSFSLKATHSWSLKFGLDTITRRIAWSVPDTSVLRFSLIPVTTPTRVRSTIHHGLDLWLMTVLVLILPSTANHEGPLGSWAVVPLKAPFRNERLTEWDKVK